MHLSSAWSGEPIEINWGFFILLGTENHPVVNASSLSVKINTLMTTVVHSHGFLSEWEIEECKCIRGSFSVAWIAWSCSRVHAGESALSTFTHTYCMHQHISTNKPTETCIHVHIHKCFFSDWPCGFSQDVHGHFKVWIINNGGENIDSYTLKLMFQSMLFSVDLELNFPKHCLLHIFNSIILKCMYCYFWWT